MTLDVGRALREPALVASPSSPAVSTEGFDPARITEALIGVDEKLLQPIIRKAADEFYCTVLETAQDYLRDNLDYNLTAHMQMLERENQRMRTELYEVDQIVGPPWLTHTERLKTLRELDAAKVELTTLKYNTAFGLATGASK